MLARLKKIEESLGSVTGALQQRRSKANAQKVVEKEQKDAPKEPVIKQQPEKKQPPAEMIDEKKLKQKKPEVAAKKPVLIQTNFAVALGDYSSLKQLKQAWKKISTKHKTDLAALSPRFVPVLHKNKVRYELISGPLKNALDAVQLRYRLLQAKTACKQAIFQGKNI